MNRKVLFVLFFSFLLPGIHAQQVTIYADAAGNDSLANFISILKEQLLKASSYRFEQSTAGAFMGKGIYLANAAAGKTKIKSTSALSRAGVEGFSIVADGKAVQITGNSNMAVGHGIFTWLESIGYRFYFANPDWHIVPARPDLYKKQSLTSSPSFYHRRIFYGYGTGSPKADKDFAFWMLANKMGGSLNAIFGHAYDDIVARNTETFKQHPEWFYPVPAKGTLPANPKFDMSNEALVQFVIQDAIKRVDAAVKRNDPSYKMITMGPSDDVGVCNTPACQKLGTPTDRVYYLVNRVAAALRKKYPDTKVGCLAYSEYIAPPTIKIEPNVYVSVTTAFNNSNLSIDQLIDGWKKTGAMVGLYDYFSWFAWDQDLPGQSIASRTKDLERNIRKYYKKGVKGYDGESSIGWVSKGLGYYLASRLMWDAEAGTASIRKEFFDRCFGKAADLMRSLWDEWEEYGFAQARESDLARWIDLSNEALKKENDDMVTKRLFQVRSYLYYLCLLRDYQLNKSEANLLNLLTYGYRKLDDGSVAGYAAFFELGNRSNIPGMAWGKDARWRTNQGQVTPSELDNLLRSFRGRLKIAEPVTRHVPKQDLKRVPLSNIPARLVADSVNSVTNSFLINNEWVMQLLTKSKDNFLEMRGDFSKNRNNTKPIIISIYKWTANGDFNDQSPLKQFFYTASNEAVRYNLGDLPAGNYSLYIEDPIKLYSIKFSNGVNYSAVMRPTRQLQIATLNYGFIYVPTGTKRFNIIKSRTIRLLSPTGREVNLNSDKVEDTQVEVKQGETGLWRILFATDKLFIEGIPPFVGLSARQMLTSEP